MYTLDNRPVSVTDSTAAIILYGPVSCSACFGQLTKAIRASDSSVRIIGLLKTSSRSVVDRRIMLQRARKLFSADLFVFDEASTSKSLDTATGGIFAQYRVYQTPCLILRSKGQSYFYDFKTLFYADDSTNADYTYLDSVVRTIIHRID